MDTQKKNVRLDEYAGGAISRVREEARRVQERFQPELQNATEVHQLADQLRELSGSLKMAYELAPRIVEEHRRGVQRSLESLLLATRRAKATLYIETAQREAIEQRIAEIVALVEADELSSAEHAIRDLEKRIEDALMAGAQIEFELLLAGIDSAASVH